MKNPLLSVIIPAYNASQVINKCLDSVCGQTFSDFEVLVVNDCSTDNSLELIKNYATKDSRIKCINLQENRGVANARNQGIIAAQGTYITCIDADDFVDKEFFSTALNKENIGFDLIVLGYYEGNNNNFKPTVPINFEAKNLTDIKTIYNELEEQWILFAGPWAKFYRTELLKNNNISFPNFSLGEDQCFVFNVLCNISNVKTINFPGYYYIRNEGQSLSRGTKRSFYEVSEFLNLKFSLENEFRKKIGKPIKTLEHFSNINLFAYLSRLKALYSRKHKINRKERIDTLQSLRKEPWCLHYKQSNFNLKYNILKPVILNVPVLLADRLLFKIFK